MPTLNPEALLTRHVEKLRARPDGDKVSEVLSRAGLRLVGGRVSHGMRTIDISDCYAYKQAVKQVYGDAIYAFAKVNFLLGGCSCRDCSG